MERIILIFLYIGYAFSAYSQHNFIDRFTVRQSFQSYDQKAEPAILTFTKPKDKDESWLLNIAIGYNLLKNNMSVLSVDPYYEYHKNTLIDKKQDNWQAGVSSQWLTSNFTKRAWTPILITAIKYNEDKIKQITSFQGNIYFTPLFKAKTNAKYFWIPNNSANFGKVFQFYYSPYIGLENENRLKTEKDSTEGDIYRIFFRIASNILLFSNEKNPDGKFEFNVDWQYRYNIKETVKDLTKSEHKFFTTSFNYIFFSSSDGKKSAKIGIDYTNGENPTKNFEQQSFYAVSLKFKL